VTEAEKRAKKQLAHLVIWLAVIFAACSLPFAIYFLFLVSADSKTVQDNYETLFVLHRVSRFLLFANSFFNPLLYALQSSNYRDGFKMICNIRLHCCKPFVNNVVHDVSLSRVGRTVQATSNDAYVLS